MFALFGEVTLSSLLYAKHPASVFETPFLDVPDDEIGVISFSSPVILLQTPENENLMFAFVLTSIGLGWINVNNLTADR